VNFTQTILGVSEHVTVSIPFQSPLWNEHQAMSKIEDRSAMRTCVAYVYEVRSFTLGVKFWVPPVAYNQWHNQLWANVWTHDEACHVAQLTQLSEYMKAHMFVNNYTKSSLLLLRKERGQVFKVYHKRTTAGPTTFKLKRGKRYKFKNRIYSSSERN